MEIRKFTNRKSNNTILPIIQPDNTVIFEENSKAIELASSLAKGYDSGPPSLHPWQI